jgi:hypothetical protein
MQEFPVNYLDELVGQSPYFARKYKTYAAFSQSTFDDLLTEEMKERIELVNQVNTTSSYVVWNEGEDGFVFNALPRAVQVAPVSRTIVRDFNADGLDDILLAGNDHSYNISTGYYDANRGLLLLSENGKALSRLMHPRESGLSLFGMVESLLFLEGESPLIIAGMNRDSTIVYQVNP